MVARIRSLLETRQLTPTQFADVIGVARPIVSHILSGRNKPSLEVVQRILAALPDLSMPWLLNGHGPMLAAGIGLPAVPAPAPVAAPPALPVSLAPAQVAETDDRAEYSNSQLPDNKLTAPLVASAPVSDPSVSARNRPSAPAVTASDPVPTVASASIPFPTDAPPAAPPLVRPTIRRFAASTLANKGLVATATAAETTSPATIATSVVPQQPAQEAVVTTPVDSIEAPTKAIEQQLPQQAPGAGAAAAALFAGSEKPIRRIVIFYRDGSFADYQPE